jgi:hypothetical protein
VQHIVEQRRSESTGNEKFLRAYLEKKGGEKKGELRPLFRPKEGQVARSVPLGTMMS